MHGKLTIVLSILICASVAFSNGILTGNVRDYNSQTPLNPATVEVRSGSTVRATTTTDSNGVYRVSVTSGGPYSVRASAPYHTDSTAHNVFIDDNDVLVENFLLRAPLIRFAPDSMDIVLERGELVNRSFSIFNEGSDSLAWHIRYRLGFTGDETNEMFDTLLSIPIETVTHDTRILGVTHLNDSIFVSGANSVSNPNKIYVLDRMGTLARSFDQPTTESDYGYRSLTNDGTYLYGSGSSFIDVVDPATGALVRRFQGPCNPNRVAFDQESRTLWIADLPTQLYHTDTTGQIIRTYANPGIIRGIAIHPEDPDGYRIYISNSRGTAPNDSSWISKMRESDGNVRYVRTLERGTSYESYGCDISNRWSPFYWVLLQVFVNPTGVDRLMIYEQQVSVPWMQLGTLAGFTARNDSSRVNVRFDATRLDTGMYRSALLISSNVSDTLYETPIRFQVVTSGANEAATQLPTEFSIGAAYPNPFNPETRIDVRMPTDGVVAVALFDVTGRQLHDFTQSKLAGTGTIIINGNSLSNGTYFAQIRVSQNGRQVAQGVRKIVLIK